MSRADEPTTTGAGEPIHREYMLGVRIVEIAAPAGDDNDGGDGGDAFRYRFEAPHHRGEVFEDADHAELYADVYFDVNGFEEAGTGERGVPPVIIQAGRDTLAAYFLTRPGTDVNWIASFYGVKNTTIERYVSAVRERATEIRAGAADRGVQ